MARRRTAIREGRYRILSRIGEGADAVVYLARDELAGEVVALKALRAEATPGSRERLRMEFARLAALRHPRLVAVRDLQVAGPADAPLTVGQLFFTADHVVGRASRAHFAELSSAQRPVEGVRLLGEVASALSAIHAAGLVHGDVKPDNVLMGPGGAVLCDLGLARARSLAGEVAGTPRYLAPEALCGQGDARADLWSLGITLWELVEGAPPWREDPPVLFERILNAALPALRSAPADLGRVLLRLLERDPARRYASAEAVEVEAARLAGDATGAAEILSRKRPLSLPSLCGRDAELSRLAEFIAATGPALRAVAVVGPPGVGKSRLVKEAIRLHQVRAAAGLAGPREFLLEVPAASRTRVDDLDGVAAGILDNLSEHERPVTLCLRSSPSEPFADRLAQSLLRDADPPRLLLVVEADAAPAWAGWPGASTLLLAPLAAAEGARLLESMGGESFAGEAGDLVGASGGLPGLLELLARARHAGDDPAASVGVSNLLSRRIRRLSPDVRTGIEALAVMGRAADVHEVSRMTGMRPQSTLAALGEGVREGLCEQGPAGYEVRGVAVEQATLAGLPARRMLALHRAADAQGGAGAPVRVRARHAEVLRSPGRAAPLAIEAGEAALAALAFSEAAGHLEFALRAGSARIRERAALALADTRALGGDYDGALDALARAGSGDEVGVQRGRLLLRAGRYDDAASALHPLWLGANGDVRLQAGALLGRIDLARGRSEAARDRCGDPDRLPATPGGRAMLEIAGLARLYLGRPAEARECFERAGRAPAGDGTTGEMDARVPGLLGMVAYEEGELREAATRYAEALAAAQRTGDVHSQAMFAANLGVIDQERGRYGDALRRVALAARQLGRLGRTAEWAYALFNHGNLLVRLGDPDGAREMLDRAKRAATEAGGDRLEAYAASLEGDILRATGAPQAATLAYQRAIDGVERSSGGEGALGEALTGLAAALREAGRIEEAAVQLARAATLLKTPSGLARVVIERARQVPPGDADLPSDLLQTCARLREIGALDLLWRAELWLACHCVGPAAAAAIARSREIFEEVLMSTPDPYRDGLRRDPDARRLAAVAAPAAPVSTPVAAAMPSAPAFGDARVPHEPRLRRLLAINKRLNSETRLPRLLEYIVDTMIELCDAERGFLVLVDDKGGFSVRTARNITAQTIAADEFSLSRSIAEQAARTGQPIVTVDAASDERFSAAMSVSAMRLRSVLAAPLRVKGKVVGTLYVDHRLRRGAFSDDDVAAVLDFADQAAIAIDNANMASELRRQAREIDRIRQELQRRVERREAEIEELRTEVVHSREALLARHPYDSLVGRAAPMRAMFALLDRVSATELPVVICGESGTGKELVARAIHSNGPRRERAFVSENCSAIPETLLESILFGHVRGAFTGADRDRRGLFEVADGGTLFLDEVGEMSPAMQAKLLRVLQDGEFRRVGGEQVMRARVRVVAASNKDLQKLVSGGRFREDLYYRLSVVRIDVPTLRDRREDIPLLCEHFLQKHFPTGRRAIDPAALRALAAYRWPGNVRELENVVLRAAALGDGPIRVADLPAELQPGLLPAADPDDLRIRGRVEDLERDLIRRALLRVQGNQSRAAKLLGVSRFGLHKKMQRFRIRVAT